MIDRRIVRRYTTALYNQAAEVGVVDQVESDLGLISYVFENNPRLEESITSPMIPASTKLDIVTGIFQGKIHEIAFSYLCLLIDNRREEAIRPTEAEYIRLANDQRGIAVVQITSAVALTGSETAGLRERLAQITGKQIVVDLMIDPGILGGLIVRIGDTVMDGSIVGHLEKLKQEFQRR